MLVQQLTGLGDLYPPSDDLDEGHAHGRRQRLELVRDRRLTEAEGLCGARETAALNDRGEQPELVHGDELVETRGEGGGRADERLIHALMLSQ